MFVDYRVRFIESVIGSARSFGSGITRPARCGSYAILNRAPAAKPVDSRRAISNPEPDTVDVFKKLSLLLRDHEGTAIKVR